MCIYLLDFPGGAVDKNLPDNAGDAGLIPGLVRSLMLQGNEARGAQLLSLRSRAWDPRDCSPRAGACAPPQEKPLQRGLHTATRETPPR